MLDVHPPHHPTHGWRDFFIHIATIVVGLLIAVGLEQTVEAVRHRQEAAELRESLRRESEQIRHDSDDTARGVDYHQHWLTQRILDVQARVWDNKPLAAPAAYDPPVFDYPDDPLWRSAKTTGIVARLNADEINAYSEVELLSVKVDVFYVDWRTAEGKRVQFEKQFPTTRASGGAVPDKVERDLSKASEADMRIYLTLLIAEADASRGLLVWDLDLLGAQNSILKGDLNLEHIFNAERAAVGQPTNKKN